MNGAELRRAVAPAGALSARIRWAGDRSRTRTRPHARPYLALAVQLAAGLDGIDRGLDPGQPNRDNLYLLRPEEVAQRGIRALPPTLLHATDELVADDVLRAALGQTPDGDYIDYFARIKREEFLAWHSAVTDWEVERYLTLF
jgi:glutamine synthetase